MKCTYIVIYIFIYNNGFFNFFVIPLHNVLKIKTCYNQNELKIPIFFNIHKLLGLKTYYPLLKVKLNL